MSAPSPKNVLAEMLRAADHSDATAGAVELPGTAPVLPSSIAGDAAAQATIAIAGGYGGVCRESPGNLQENQSQTASLSSGL
jgi:hypothetical protein